MRQDRKRPVGLTVFAIINLVSAIITSLSLFAIIFVPSVGEHLPVSTAYTILSPAITLIFLVISSIGFFRLSWSLGYVAGNILSVGTILNYIVFNILTSFEQLVIQIPFALYYCLLLYFLNTRYKDCFTQRESNIKA